MSAVADGVGCGLCAPAARGRGRGRGRESGAGRGGRQRSGEGRGHRAERGRRERDSIADGTALRCGRVGSRHFQSPRGFIPEGSFRGHYSKYTSSNAVWLKVLGCAPLSPEIENCWGPRTNEICAESLRATAPYSPFFCLSINLSVKKCRNGETTTSP